MYTRRKKYKRQRWKLWSFENGGWGRECGEGGNNNLVICYFSWFSRARVGGWFFFCASTHVIPSISVAHPVADTPLPRRCTHVYIIIVRFPAVILLLLLLLLLLRIEQNTLCPMTYIHTAFWDTFMRGGIVLLYHSVCLPAGPGHSAFSTNFETTTRRRHTAPRSVILCTTCCSTAVGARESDRHCFVLVYFYTEREIVYVVIMFTSEKFTRNGRIKNVNRPTVIM